MSDVFISYSHTDREYVERLVATLEAENFNVWWDPNINAGTRWENSIHQNIIDSHAIIVVMSRPAEQSDYVANEIAVAKKHKKRFFPLWLRDDDWLTFAHLQMIDVRGEVLPQKDFYEVLRQHLQHPAQWSPNAINTPASQVEVKARGTYLNYLREILSDNTFLQPQIRRPPTDIPLLYQTRPAQFGRIKFVAFDEYVDAPTPLTKLEWVTHINTTKRRFWILLGASGSGRSATLRTTYIELTTQALRQSSLPIPLWISLSEYTSGQKPDLFIDQYLTARYESDEIRAYLKAQIQDGHLALFIDDTDQLLDIDLRRFVDWADNIVGNNSTASVLLVSKMRPNANEVEASKIVVARLTEAHIRAAIRGYEFPADYEAKLWTILNHPLFVQPENTALPPTSAVMQLISSPLFLFELLDLLYNDSATFIKVSQASDELYLIHYLFSQAFGVASSQKRQHKFRPTTEEIAQFGQWVLGLIELKQLDEKMQHFLKKHFICDENMKFRHSGFEVYFKANGLLDLIQYDETFDAQGWWTPFDEMYDSDQPPVDELEAKQLATLAFQLTDLRYQGPSKTAFMGWLASHHIELTEYCLETMLSRATSNNIDPIAQEMQTWLQNQIAFWKQNSSKQKNLVQRIREGQLVARFSIKQEDIHRPSKLPIFEWAESPDVLFPIVDPSGEITHYVHVPAFAITKTLVTVRQYQLFIDANGYEKDEYWARYGRPILVENDAPVFDPQHKPVFRTLPLPLPPGITPTSPRVNITWQETLAYCLWLTQRDRTSAPKEYRLPTELEWETAACFDPEIKKRRAIQPPVIDFGKVYPVRLFGELEFVSPLGCFDMLGNAAQWCMSTLETRYVFPYPNIQTGSDDLLYTARVIRGITDMNYDAGRFANEQPFYAGETLGFRIVRGISLISG